MPASECGSGCGTGCPGLQAFPSLAPRSPVPSLLLPAPTPSPLSAWVTHALLPAGSCRAWSPGWPPCASPGTRCPSRRTWSTPPCGSCSPAPASGTCSSTPGRRSGVGVRGRGSAARAGGRCGLSWAAGEAQARICPPGQDPSAAPGCLPGRFHPGPGRPCSVSSCQRAGAQWQGQGLSQGSAPTLCLEGPARASG